MVVEILSLQLERGTEYRVTLETEALQSVFLFFFSSPGATNA